MLKTHSGLRALACAAAKAAFEVPGFFAADCKPEKNDVGFAITCLGAMATDLTSEMGFFMGTPALGTEVALPAIVLDASFFEGASDVVSTTLRFTPAIVVIGFAPFDASLASLTVEAGTFAVSFLFLDAALSIIRLAEA